MINRETTAAAANMSEFIEDSAIKLFGKSISLSPDKVVSDDNTEADLLEQRQSFTETSTSQDREYVSGGDLNRSKKKVDFMNPTEVTLAKLATSSANIDDSKKTGCLENNPLYPNTPKKEEPSESIASQEKTLTKPDKILPCPRCNSMDTKFCYNNNYNANQPRHFCKNCQRYWTAGGTTRNVPVGSGGRKNKNFTFTNCGHAMVLDAFQATRADAINGIHFSSLKHNGFLNFGSDRSQNHARNEFFKHSSRPSSANSHSTEKGSNADLQKSGAENFQDMFSRVPCFNQPPWTCPWNPVKWTWTSPAPHAFDPSGFSITFYPQTPSSTLSLGKHSREGTLLRPPNSRNNDLPEKKNAERCVLIPKTLNEATSTLGIKNENASSVDGTSFFKDFQSKGHWYSSTHINTIVLRANPAALCRSLNFHESL